MATPDFHVIQTEDGEGVTYTCGCDCTPTARPGAEKPCVFPGKKMSGHMGAVNRTQQGLEVVRVDVERHLIAVKGAVPGAPGGDVIIRPTTKG